MNQDQSAPIIGVAHLTKRFGETLAVNDISFQVRPKSVFAFLGPNGAGKSTTIKMLITLLQPTAGGATIGGIDIIRTPAEVRRMIGYVPQLISVDGTLTAYENLMLMARLYDIPSAMRKARIAEVLSFLGLEEQRDTLVKNFSGGMIRRLEIGQAILHKPAVVFLDEPTSGLDPVGRQNVWKHLLQLRDVHGTTIFFSTHQMEEAQDLSDDVAIMHKGKIVIQGAPDDIRARTGNPDATMEDAFIFFTGAKMEDITNFRDVRRARQRAKRLG